MNRKQYINVLIKARVCPSGVTATANTCPHTHINTHWCLCEGTEPFPYARHALTHKHTHTCLCSQTFIHFGPTALECHVKLSEFMKKIRFMDGSSFIFLSVQFFFFFFTWGMICVVALLGRWPSVPEPAPHTQTHTHTGDYHMGSRVLGGETRRVLTPLFLWPFASLHQKRQQEKERKKRGGGGGS